MKSLRLTRTDGASAHASRFAAEGGAEEHHLHVLPGPGQTFEQQLASLEAMYAAALGELRLGANTAVFRRVFLSDAANQEQQLRLSQLGERDAANPVALSVIEQPPLPELKLALWAYHVRDARLDKRALGNGVAVKRGECTHLYVTQLGAAESPMRSAHDQTREAFDGYLRILGEHRASLSHDVIRTWLFVQGIDQHYQGMVTARRELFERHGLTNTTHFIASTGIEGRSFDHRRLVLLDAYAIAGVESGQVRHLTALGHLGPTSEYGVTFERGTRVAHGDRAHVFISGTASIDPKGNTLHVGDLEGQTRRAFENVTALLADAGGGAADIAQMLVYLRDPADRPFVERYLRQFYPDIPAIVLRAPVCRPSWLVEVECVAITPNADARWQSF